MFIYPISIIYTNEYSTNNHAIDTLIRNYNIYDLSTQARKTKYYQITHSEDQS